MSAADVFGVKPKDGVFTHYRCELQVLDVLAGGIPKDPDTIRKWLSARLDMGDRELIELAERTYAELSQDGSHPTSEEMLDAVVSVTSPGRTFKQHPETGNLAWEGRCAKAALKEAANIGYPGIAFPGKPKDIRKGLRNFLSETVFVPEIFIDLGTKEYLTEQYPQHMKTKAGPMSAIAVRDVVHQPRVSFTIRVLRDCIASEVWATMFQILENIGIGADRGRSDGKFELLAFDRIPG